MNWLEIPVEGLKQSDKDREARRMGNDGMKALLHDRTYDMLAPPIMMLSEGGGLVEGGITYPYPLVDEEGIDNSGNWVSDEVA